MESLQDKQPPATQLPTQSKPEIPESKPVINKCIVPLDILMFHLKEN